MSDTIKKALIDGPWTGKGRRLPRPVKRMEDGVRLIARSLFSGGVPIKKDRITFMTYDNDYSCNPKYIAREILRRGLPWELIWVVEPDTPREHFPPDIRTVLRGSYDAFRAMAGSRIWVDNALSFTWNQVRLPKKNEQIYVNTWHGSMGIKRIAENDVQDRKWVSAAKRLRRMTDLCISNSVFETEVFRSSYWPETEILPLGHARNDCLFDPAAARTAREKLREELFLPLDVNLLLYAPTFRDDGRRVYEEADFSRVAEALERRFGGHWRILLKLHYHDRDVHPDTLPDCVVNVTGHPDIQELMLAADAGMTDYSSWAYDFILTRRPLFIFAPDLAKYDTERGLYYPLENTPFPIAADSEQLAENILSFDGERYLAAVKTFLTQKGCVEDGHAAERIVDKFREIIDGT